MRLKLSTSVGLVLVLLGAFLAWRMKPGPERVAEPASPPGADQQTGEWPAYGGDKANSKYSPLDQIGTANVKKLRIAWRWPSPDAAVLKSLPHITTGHFETTPLMVHGV